MASRIHREVYVRFWREYGTVEVDDRLCLPHDLDIQVSRLKIMKGNHISQIYRLEDKIAKDYPAQIASLKEVVAGYRTDIQTYAQNKFPDKDSFSMKIGDRIYTDKKEAGTALIDICRGIKQPGIAAAIGEYQGFRMLYSYDLFASRFTVNLKGNISHAVEIGTDSLGNLQRLSNALEGMTRKMEEAMQKLENVERQLETAKNEVAKPFPQEVELAEKLKRLVELNTLLNIDEKDSDGIGMDDDTGYDEDQEEPDTVEIGDITEAVPDVPFSPQINGAVAEKVAGYGKEGILTGNTGGRASLKEKLAVVAARLEREKAYGQKVAEKPGMQKNQGKEETL